MERVRAVLLSLVGACYSAGHVGGMSGDAGDAGSGADTQLVDTPPGDVCFGSQMLDRLCVPAGSVMAGMLPIGSSMIDTSQHMGCAAAKLVDNTDVCVVIADSVIVTGTVLTEGSAPLVIVGVGSVELA